MNLYQFPFKAMGTCCDIQIYAADAMSAQYSAQIVIDDIERLETKYSRYRSNSFLSRINTAAANGEAIKVDSETASLLNYAETCYRESDGLFDITSGILRRVWNFTSGKLPEQGEINALLEKIGWHQLLWRSPLLSFTVEGMELDFGGIVKEYAVDRAATLCEETGIRHGIINLGGDIRVIGPHPGGSPWRVAVRHPNQTDALLESLELTSGALASSGDYERCITIEGVRYGHILNPKKGWPVRGMAAVSVSAEFCVIAGSASTIAMLKEDAGKEWLKGLGLQHLWMDTAGNSGGSLARK